MNEAILVALVGIEAIKAVISRKLISLDRDIVNYNVGKYGTAFGLTYIVVLGPTLEELGFRIMPWLFFHSLTAVGIFTVIWWLLHLGNLKYVRAGYAVIAMYMVAVGLGGINYVLSLTVSPILPFIIHIINNAYSVVLVYVKRNE